MSNAALCAETLKKMIISKFSHGGNLWQIAEKYEILPEEIIDFSANTNPWGTSLGVVKAIKERMESIFHYPDPECRELTRRLSEHLRLDRRSIMVGGGSTEIIYLVMRALRPRWAIIPAPTFTEYERALKLAGGKTKFLFLKEKRDFILDTEKLVKKAKGIQMIVLCNPNNPTGKLISRAEVEKVINKAKEVGVIVVVDESFIDFQPQCSLVDKVKNNGNLLILRSFTKFFSIAGLRLGYAVGSKELMTRIKSFKEPWTVSSLAQVAGIHILKNMRKADELKELVKKEREFLYTALDRIEGIKPYTSQANFILAKIEVPLSSGYISEKLIKRGILIRDCRNFPGLSDKFIRIAVRKREENQKLIHHLGEALRGEI